jgi:uncharacterized Fe-S cluster protein YjdI
MANAPLDDSVTREYPAGSLVIEWRQGLCQHSGHCVRALPRVFNPRRQPWIQTDGANADDLRETVAKCPSGALKARATAGE